MTKLQEQILKAIKFSGKNLPMAIIAKELEATKSNISARLSEMKTAGILGYDTSDHGYYVNDDFVAKKVIEKEDLNVNYIKKEDGFAELDNLSLSPQLKNKAEKLAMLGRLKSMFTRCELNSKLHSIIDEIANDYK